ncbi:MAG TPA: SDR family oxidoreductase [Candidatus Baltobacteraceae bacterium]|nr:SDR family oxidoreductase [Candidatus Baltobacteraceae bacterium]
MDLELAGRVAIVLAASKGLGRACAQALADEGASVAIGARDAATLEATAAAIRERSRARVIAVPVDVRAPEQCEAIVDATLREYGRIDILVNNAGGPPFAPFERFDDEAWRAAFELNLLSTVRMTRLVLPHLPRDGRGRVINIVSFSVKSVLENSVLSTAMRSGVVGMTKLLADEVGPHGITVNNVAPGAILTDRLRETGGGALEKRASRIPLRRIGTPEEFASVVAFLASARASYVTGTTIPVDGGAMRAIS